MKATIIDGRALAKSVRDEVATRVSRLREQHGMRPGLAVILAGDDQASQIYVRNKSKMADRVGIAAQTIRLPASVPTELLIEKIHQLNADPDVHGILVQLPLPPGDARRNERRILDEILPDKDVDGLHPVNLGRLLSNQQGFVACTPSGCMRMLESAEIDLEGKHAVVIGRSTIVGKPMALLLTAANATVTLCHSRTVDLPQLVRSADVVIAAVGRAEMVKASWIKPGAAVIDVGINRNAEGKLLGDVAFNEVVHVAGSLSPVPGGVGPMTIAYLLSNVCQAAERSLAKEAR